MPPGWELGVGDTGGRIRLTLLTSMFSEYNRTEVRRTELPGPESHTNNLGLGFGKQILKILSLGAQELLENHSFLLVRKLVFSV